MYRALCEVSSILVPRLHCMAFHHKDNRFLLYGIGSIQIQGQKTRKTWMGRQQGYLVDLIVVDIPDGEEVLGLDLQDREKSIPADFNDCDGSEYDNVLKIAKAVLQKDGVIAFMRLLFIAAHDDLLNTAISKWWDQFHVLPQHYLIPYNVFLNNVGLKTRKIDLVHWTNSADPMHLIEDPEHPMYKDDALKNFVPDEVVVKAGENLALKGSRQLAPSFF
jgi:hypothetical protein